MPMTHTFRSSLLSAIEREQITIAEVARRSGVSQDQLNKLRQRESAKTNVDDAHKIAKSFGKTLDDFLEGNLEPANPTISVAARVGAGAKVQMSDPYAKGDGLYHVVCPPQLSPHGIVAVEVEGNSMEPAYEQGDVLFYTRDTVGVPSDAIGRRCVVEDADGMVWVKLLRRRDDQPECLFDLISFHTDSPPMYDTAIKWAAPITMHLGRDLVVKI
jgi:phage repressor protein C with HTH and peptisase S24 domain